MKRWHLADLHQTSLTLFNKIYRRKRLAHHNHELHFLARDIDNWLPAGLQSIKDGSYTPRFIKRLYFEDDIVDQLYPTDRIFQHCLLQQIKSTFEPSGAFRCDPHPRTLRKAREQMKVLVNDKVSPPRIRTYWLSFVRWWTTTCPFWTEERFVHDFLAYCWDQKLAKIVGSFHLGYPGSKGWASMQGSDR